MKSRTWQQVEAMKARAARFVRDVLGDAERAGEIEDKSPEEYAERKRIEVLDNPPVLETVTITRRTCMARASKTKDELQAEIDEANDYIEELEGKLDDIAGIAADEDEEADDTAEGEDQGE